MIRNKIIWAKRNPMPSPSAIGSPAPGRSSICSSGSATTSSTSTPSASRTPARKRPPRPKRLVRAARLARHHKQQQRPRRTRQVRTRRSPARQEPRRRLAAFDRLLPRRPPRRLPSRLSRAPDHSRLPGTALPNCRLPWKRATIRKLGHLAVRGELQATCACSSSWEPGVVLDPFIGSGTTAIAAEQHGRNWLGIELNPAFARLADKRIEGARDARERRAA